MDLRPPPEVLPASLAETEQAFLRMTESALQVMSDVHNRKGKGQKPTAAAGGWNQWDATV